jgi:hypothetical protein
MINRLQINNYRFSIEFCTIAANYGHKTIGSFEKALKKARPTTKWSNGVSYVRGSRLLREIELFKQ